MKLMEKMKEKKKDNKGFSLVELIIVIAIMAILVGIVGTQVIPYLSKSKVAKDQQVLNSYSTAAVTAFSENAEDMPSSGSVTVKVYTGTYTAGNADAILQDAVKELTGYASLADFKDQLASQAKDDAADVELTYDITNNKLTAAVTYTSGKTVKYPVEKVEATL